MADSFAKWPALVNYSLQRSRNRVSIEPSSREARATPRTLHNFEVETLYGAMDRAIAGGPPSYLVDTTAKTMEYGSVDERRLKAEHVLGL